MIGNYADLLNHSFDYSTGIPKVIYRTGRYKLNELPDEVLALYERELAENPEYTLFYFDDEDCEKLIADTMDAEVLKSYQTLIPSAFKADLWRYVVLYVYGGVYIDFTMHTLVPYNDIVKHYRRQIYVRDACDICGVYNAFMATIPESELLKKAIEQVCENVAKRKKGVGALDVTGPTMLGRIFKNKLSLNFYDWIPIGNIRNDLYMYANPENKYIQDEFGNRIIKNRLDKHYELTYNVKNANLVQGNVQIMPMDHYSRLWAEDRVFAQ